MEKKKRPDRSKAPRKTGRGKHRLIKIIAVLCLVPIIVVAAFLIRYYYVFNGLIQEKLGKRDNVLETEIYARPVVIYPGRQMKQVELVTRLRRLGYNEGANARNAGTASYEVVKDRVSIHNDATAPQNPNDTVDVVFSSTSIRSIRNLANRAPVERFALKPEMLSTTINKNREKRRYVAYRDLPKVVVDAVVASEDRRFFSHSGVDPIRIIKALIVDVREGDKVQGASTLTQQFVKNYFLTQEKTWKRKITDAYMSILLEQRLSKQEILELYCNDVYLGQRGSFSIVGIGEAAEAFFHKNVKDLTAGEAAMIAGIITAPNRFSPLRYPDRAATRRNLVLDGMAEEGMISPKERDEARQKPLDIKPSTILNYSDAPYFVDYVQDLLVERYGDAALAGAKYKVYTALDPELQQIAFESVREGIQEMDAYFSKGKRAIPPGTVQASLIAVDPRSGEILTMIGGRNYGVTQFNRITQAKRQPGSIFKPFVYAAALESAYNSSTPLTAVSTVVDEPTQFAFENLSYEPRNFKDEYFGQVTMRQAITKSLNVATIKFAEKVGYGRVTELAHRLGLNELIKPYPAMAIGAFEVTPLEMVRAYTAFANGGMMVDLTPIQEIRDSRFQKIFSNTPKPTQVLTPEISFLVTSLLQSVINNGTGAGSRARGFTLPAAGKTGTSRDGWFAGYTPDLLCIVWVGFDDNRELNLEGSKSALPIWTSFMKKAISIVPLRGDEFSIPEGLPEVEIDPTTGLRATERCIERQTEYFIRGTEPTLFCYGNNYEQMLGGNPTSIYASPAKDPGAGDKTVPAEEKKKPTS
jgi:penicillin-binding protein 1B